MTKGPIPKRSEERIRRNKPEVEITKIETEGTVPVPPLDIDDPHPMIEDFYESLKDSAPDANASPSQNPRRSAIALATSENRAVPLSAATTR